MSLSGPLFVVVHFCESLPMNWLSIALGAGRLGHAAGHWLGTGIANRGLIAEVRRLKHERAAQITRNALQRGVDQHEAFLEGLTYDLPEVEADRLRAQYYRALADS